MGDFLREPLTSLKGVGPARSRLLSVLGVKTAEDILWFFPRRYEDRRNVTKVSSLVPGRPSVVYASVDCIERRKLQKPGLELVKAELSDETGTFCAVWFNRKGLEYILKEGTPIVLYGVPSFHGSYLEFASPEFELLSAGAAAKDFCCIMPIYPSTAGLPAKWFRNFAFDVVRKAAPLADDELPPFIKEKRKFPDLKDALISMHRPQSPEDWKNARRRIAYGELFVLLTAMEVRRAKLKSQQSAALVDCKGGVYSSFRANLPFALTESQEKVLSEIFADTSSGTPMSRLVQGDVGAGKTLLAVGLAAAASDSGVQTALLAPTEVLADQLFAQMKKYLSESGASVVLLKGSQSAKERKKIISEIESGLADIIVGTQALLQESIPYKKLGVVIIDEQHRFGVAQRGRFAKITPVPHMLMMSATPIPRTLTMTLFGDLDISVLKDKPAGRQKIETRIADTSKMRTLLRFVADEAGSGGKIYWVCPRVNEDGEETAASAETRYKYLEKQMGALGVALLHGAMNEEHKNSALENFKNGKAKILVATTVIEVGVDVPDASLIIIESPERFGLSQLHQLRGRVGRGTKRGVCILLVREESLVPERLRVLEKSCDGFEIAEADLAQRGAGEINGSYQHGDCGFKTVDLSKDIKLIKEAKEDAAYIAATDINLTSSPKLKVKIDAETGDFLGIG